MTTGTATGTVTGTRIGTWTDKIVLTESKKEKINLFQLNFVER